MSCHDAPVGCENGDVRLLGGGFDNEGTVEVCLDNLWGLVSDEGWTDLDAKVVCNQLGYTGGSESNIALFAISFLLLCSSCTGHFGIVLWQAKQDYKHEGRYVPWN